MPRVITWIPLLRVEEQIHVGRGGKNKFCTKKNKKRIAKSRHILENEEVYNKKKNDGFFKLLNEAVQDVFKVGSDADAENYECSTNTPKLEYDFDESGLVNSCFLPGETADEREFPGLRPMKSVVIEAHIGVRPVRVQLDFGSVDSFMNESDFSTICEELGIKMLITAEQGAITFTD